MRSQWVAKTFQPSSSVEQCPENNTIQNPITSFLSFLEAISSSEWVLAYVCHAHTQYSLLDCMPHFFRSLICNRSSWEKELCLQCNLEQHENNQTWTYHICMHSCKPSFKCLCFASIATHLHLLLGLLWNCCKKGLEWRGWRFQLLWDVPSNYLVHQTCGGCGVEEELVGILEQVSFITQSSHATDGLKGNFWEWKWLWKCWEEGC